VWSLYARLEEDEWLVWEYVMYQQKFCSWYKIELVNSSCS
jgi:hypothetical protein